jgi:farnesyl-diphosphate farnesyltransferase
MAALPQSLNRLLREVSRSFYLTLRALPGAIRPQIGLAYLLARATDTIADTQLVAPALRLSALQLLRHRIEGNAAARFDFGELARRQGSPGERVLLERIEEAIALLAIFPASDQQRIRAVLHTITSGQELDLVRFGAADSTALVSLQTPAELDDYTYRVAGCVGEFWTHLCRAHLFPGEALNEAQLFADAVRFGKGLQLVNILRDLPADLRQGRCYLPASELQTAGLNPRELLDAANMPRLRPLYDRYLNLAHEHLAAGWRYTNALPRSQMRVRLACAWPILIGVKTISRLRAANVLNGARPIKVRRPEVRALMLRSLLAYPLPRAWERLFVVAAA